jgi:hypothetical protein
MREERRIFGILPRLLTFRMIMPSTLTGSRGRGLYSDPGMVTWMVLKAAVAEGMVTWELLKAAVAEGMVTWELLKADVVK